MEQMSVRKLHGHLFSALWVFVLSAVLFIGFFIFERQLVAAFSQWDMKLLENLSVFACLVVLFLVFNTAYYAFINQRRVRLLIYATAFLLASCMEFLLAVFRSGGQAEQYISDPYAYLLFSVGGRFIMALGVFIAVQVPLEKKYDRGSAMGVSMLPILLFVAFMAPLMQIEHVYLRQFSSATIAYMTAGLEFTSAMLLIVAMVHYLQMFYLQNEQRTLHAISGLTLLVFAHAFSMVFSAQSDIGFIAFSGFKLAGYTLYLIAMFRYNIGASAVEQQRAEQQIKLYADNLEKIIDKRTREIREVNYTLINELEYAKSIQQSLLPQKRMNFKTTSFISEYFPCERLSGDFYDIYRIDDDNVGMYVLDVSGHGISAALMTMFCNNYIKSTERLIKRYRGLKPHRNLKHFYEEFNKMHFPEEMHMVIFFASYNISTRILTYCTGGMNCYPIVMRKTGEFEYLDKSDGFPICKMSEFFVPEYKSAKITLLPGDRIVFYTDGLIDKFKNNVMDQDELLDIVRDSRHDSLKNLNKKIVKLIEPVKDELEDDITYFVMEA